jgi:hypothetical protein
MKKVIIGGILGAVIMFIWSFIAWSVVPLHTSTMRNIANEDSLLTVMRSSMDAKTVYVFPGMPPPAPDMTAQQKEAAMKEWEQKYAKGPTGMIFYDPKGSNPMMTDQMVIGFIISFLSVALAGWLLARSTAITSGYVTRVMYCGVLGIFISIVSHLTNWNWMGYPLDYTIAMMVDTIVGWILAGLGIAAIVKEEKPVV